MNKPTSIDPDRLAAILARLRNQNKVTHVTQLVNPNPPAVAETKAEAEVEIHETDKNGNTIVYNTKQQLAVDTGGRGDNCVIVGAAGTGKTTSQKGLVNRLIHNNIAGVLTDCESHKHLRNGTPGIVIVAFTRRAVQNIRRNMPADLQNNCITIHKLLEYQPESVEYTDEEGNERSKMQFLPKRNKENPLPRSIHTIIVEESSMLGLDLYEQLRDAFGHQVQWIFLGDIQQLPPVFGPAILGFKMLEYPVIELTEVYRQAMDSPIIRLAHRILSGTPIKGEEYPQWKVEGKLTLHPWKKKIKWEDALNAACLFTVQAIDNGLYDPDEDMILCPFNKSFGTDEINRKVANHLARKRNAVTFEIRAGYDLVYFSPGDKVLYDKEDATILSIEPNPGYTGKPTQPATNTLDYWGCNGGSGTVVVESEDDVDLDVLLANVQSLDTGERRKSSSHLVTILMDNSDQPVKIDTVGGINALALGYALTVHKSQGSEWRKVFIYLHQSHNTMIQREMLYTAVTRAKEELYVICEPETFTQGIVNQRVKGNTIEEKAEHFKGKKVELGKRVD